MSMKFKDTIDGSISKNAASATKLATKRTINGTEFDGSANITTTNWGTARNIYIADSSSTNTGAAISVNGSGNVTLKLPATIKASLTGNASTASSAAKLTTGRTIAITGVANGSATFDGSSNITIATNPTIFSSEGTSGTQGYVEFARLTITGNYTNRPIEFTLISRGRPTSCTVSIAFANTNNSDPSLSSIKYTGSDYGVFIQKTATSTWAVYATKSEAYDTIYLVGKNYVNQSITITHPGTFITTKPTENITNATLGGTINNSVFADKLKTARTITIGNKSNSFDGSANISYTLSEIGAAASGHTHDDRYYTESEINTKVTNLQAEIDADVKVEADRAKAAEQTLQANIDKKANSSHGNHVPTTQTASNSVFLRNDNTWATVTPANIGAAASSHTHDDRYFTETEINSKITTINNSIATAKSDAQKYADDKIAALVDSAPDAMNTLNELADAISDHQDVYDAYVQEVSSKLAGKSDTGHTHNYAGSSSAGGAATSANKVNTNLTIKLNSGTTEGTNLFTFNGSAAKTVNITPSSIGAAGSSHGTHVTYASATPLANGTAAVGSSSKVAREDHVHPLQTSVSGNAGTATKLATARTLTIGNTGKTFDGTANVSWSLSEMGAAAASHGLHFISKTIAAGFDTAYRTQTKGNTNSGEYLATIRNETANIANAPQFGSGLAWGRGDTHGYLYTNYSNAQLYVGGGNADKLNWVKQVSFTDHNHDSKYATASHGTHVTYSTTTPKANGTASTGSEGAVARGDHVHPLQTSVSGNAGTATKLQNAKTLTIGNKGKSFDGTQNVSWSLSEIGAAPETHSHNELSGEDLTGKTISLNDLDLNTGTSRFKVYFCPTDGGGSNITGRPDDSSKKAFDLIVESLRWASTTDYITKQTYTQGSAKIVYIRYCTNGTWTNWEKVYTSAQKPTPADIGAAASSHGTHVTYSTTAPKVAGTASVGSETSVARGDHVHAAQTSVSGNAGTATKLATARTIQIGNKSNTFDGSANISYTLADIGAATSGHTHNYAGSSSAGGAANSATKLATARTINGTTFDGSANITTANWGTSRKINQISVNGSADVKLPLDYYTCTIGASNAKPYHHILATGKCADDYTDKSITIVLVNHYNGAGFGIAKVTLRTNQASTGATATAELRWIVRSGFAENSLCYNLRNTAKDTYMDVFYKSGGTYASLTWYVLSEGFRGNHSSVWTKYNTHHDNGTNVYDETGMKAIRTYTATLQSAVDHGDVNSAKTAATCSGNAATATKLKTARNIALSGLLSGSASFDGSANISIDASVAAPPKSGDWWSGGIPTVSTGGVMEVGRYIDFHNTDTSTNDYDVRLQSNTSTPCVINLPSGGGTLARTSDSITGNAATATKLATARTIQIGNKSNSFDGSANISYTLTDIGAAPATHSHNENTLTRTLVTKTASSNTLTLGTERYQLASGLSNGGTINLPASPALLTEINLIINNVSLTTLNLPDTCKWRVDHNLEVGKYFMITFLYVATNVWLTEIKVYS